MESLIYTQTSDIKFIIAVQTADRSDGKLNKFLYEAMWRHWVDDKLNTLYMKLDKS